jgi:hypothetical protein
MKTKLMMVTGLLALAFCLPTALAQDEEKKDKPKRKGPPSKEQILKKFDENQDGALCKEELGKMPERMSARLLKLGDKDGDGALSKEEVEALDLSKRKPDDGKKKGDRKKKGDKKKDAAE